MHARSGVLRERGPVRICYALDVFCTPTRRARRELAVPVRKTGDHPVFVRVHGAGRRRSDRLVALSRELARLPVVVPVWRVRSGLFHCVVPAFAPNGCDSPPVLADLSRGVLSELRI